MAGKFETFFFEVCYIVSPPCHVAEHVVDTASVKEARLLALFFAGRSSPVDVLQCQDALLAGECVPPHGYNRRVGLCDWPTASLSGHAGLFSGIGLNEWRRGVCLLESLLGL